MKNFRTVGLMMTAVATFACSSGEAVPAPDGGAHFDAGNDGAVGDAGGADAAAPACSSLNPGDAGVATQNIGTVLIEDTTYTGAVGTMQASFFAAGTIVTPPGCATTSVGPCQVSINCTIPPTNACNSPNPGVIALTDVGDAGPPDVPWNLMPNPAGWYTPMHFGGEPPFEEGDTLTVSADGGEVPAFEHSVIGPGCVPLVTPGAPDAGLYGEYTIPTTQDFAVSWTGGEANAVVHVVLTSGPDEEAVTQVDCSFEGTAGQGTIPQAALASLPGATGGLLTVYQERSTTFQAESYQIELIARATSLGSLSSPLGTCPYNVLPAVFP